MVSKFLGLTIIWNLKFKIKVVIQIGEDKAKKLKLMNFF